MLERKREEAERLMAFAAEGGTPAQQAMLKSSMKGTLRGPSMLSNTDLEPHTNQSMYLEDLDDYCSPKKKGQDESKRNYHELSAIEKAEVVMGGQLDSSRGNYINMKMDRLHTKVDSTNNKILTLKYTTSMYGPT